MKTVHINKRQPLQLRQQSWCSPATRVTAGAHTVHAGTQGDGPLYFNAYLTNFTLEDPITSAGLEIKVKRQFYKLHPVKAARRSRGARRRRWINSRWRSTSACRWTTWTR